VRRPRNPASVHFLPLDAALFLHQKH
jgi:hypothetical protein